MPRPGPRMPQMPVRMPAEEIAAVEAVAEREDTSRSEAARLLISYATPRMPKGWRPGQEPGATTTEETER